MSETTATDQARQGREALLAMGDAEAEAVRRMYPPPRVQAEYVPDDSGAFEGESFGHPKDAPESDPKPVTPILAMMPVSLADLFTNPSPPPEFVWDGYLPRGVVSLLSAHGGGRKSMTGLMLTMATALGRPLFGVPTTQCNAAFISLEDGVNVVRHRAAWVCRGWRVDPQELVGRLKVIDGTGSPELFTVEGRGSGATTGSYEELRVLVGEMNAGLVVIDNASDAFDGDEIQRRQVRAFMRALGRMARETNCAVLLLAHVDKNTSKARKAEGGEGYSGSTQWHNSARSRLFMSSEDGSTIKIEHQKSNFGRLREPLLLEWPHDGLPQLLAVGDDQADDRVAQYQGRQDDGKAQALLRLIAEFEGRQQFCSPAPQARNNVHALLRGEPAFARLNLRQDDTKRIVNQCQRAGWLEPLDYRSLDRKHRQRWAVTELGRRFAGLAAPTAPTAPTCDDGADCAQSSRGGAPTAPTCAGGVGEERAHVGDGAGGQIGGKSAPRLDSRQGVPLQGGRP